MVNPKRCMDGRKYTLMEGQDFDDLPKTRQALYREARKAGLKLVTRTWPDGRLEVYTVERAAVTA